MSAEPPSAAGRVAATPTPRHPKTALREDAPALRLGIGRLTVDLVDAPGGVLCVAGRGVGSPTTTAAAPIATAAGLLALADTVDGRSAFDTAAWLLCVNEKQTTNQPNDGIVEI